MGYRIDKDETPGDGLARIYGEQIEKLARDLTDNDVSVPERVRRARVRCKRVRALLALAREGLGKKAWRKHNRWWRDLGRSLSDVRDLSARVEALDAVRAEVTAERQDSAISRMRAWMEMDRVAREAEWDVHEALKRFTSRLREAPSPKLSGVKTFAETEAGYARTFTAARKAMRNAAVGDDPEFFHEWRKRVKAMGLQARLLREVHPVLEADVSAGRALSSVLGMAQDIDVVLATLDADPSLPLSVMETEALEATLTARREALFGAALDLAGRFLPDRSGGPRLVRDVA